MSGDAQRRRRSTLRATTDRGLIYSSTCYEFCAGQIVEYVLSGIAVIAWIDIFGNARQPVSGWDDRRFDVSVLTMVGVARRGE